MTTSIQMPETLEAELLPGEDTSTLVAESTTIDDEPGYEEIEIKFRKSTKATASITLNESDGLFTASYNCRSTSGGAVGSLDDKFTTRKDAVLAALAPIDLAIGVGRNERIAEDIERFRQAVEAWPDEAISELTVLEETEIVESEATAEPAADSPATPDASPARLSPMDEFAIELDAATKRVAECCLTQAKAEAAAKMAKAEAKLAIETLQRIVDRGPEHYPLFDGPGQPGDRPAVAEAATDEPADEEAVETETANESWRSVSVGDLPISLGMVTKLREAGLSTIGAIADFTDGDKRLDQIEGFGKVKAEKLAEALNAFWAAHPPVDVPPGATSTTTPGGVKLHDPEVE